MFYKHHSKSKLSLIECLCRRQSYCRKMHQTTKDVSRTSHYKCMIKLDLFFLNFLSDIYKVICIDSSRVSIDSNRVRMDSSRVSIDSSRVSIDSIRVSIDSSRVSIDSHRVSIDSHRVSINSIMVCIIYDEELRAKI